MVLSLVVSTIFGSCPQPLSVSYTCQASRAERRELGALRPQRPYQRMDLHFLGSGDAA
jgi:hypothetical protein